jgi:hypothetical protein
MTATLPGQLMSISRRAAMSAAASILALGALGAAPAMAGPTLLTVTGAIAGGAEKTFDRDALMAMPRTEFTTTTVWTEGPMHFVGVSLHDLLAAVGATASTAHLVAINDYAVNLPVADALPDGATIAYEVNGKPMSVREKGPLWLVYPYDSNIDYRTEATYALSIWQLVRIDVQD